MGAGRNADSRGNGGLPEAWREPNLTLSLPSWETMATINETSLNVLLFVPLGLTIALLPRIRAAIVLFGLSVLAPMAIEVVQYVAPALDRVGLQMDDVVANEIGLLAGAAVGVVLRLFLALGRAPGYPAETDMQQNRGTTQPAVGVAR